MFHTVLPQAKRGDIHKTIHMKYFKLDEFTHSETARKLGIENNPSAEAICNIKKLVKNVLDPAREYLGQPIIITSGYRSRRINNLVGGVPSSQHCTGHAADISTSVYYLDELYGYISKTLIYDQLIYYRSKAFIHVSYVSHRKNRMQTIIK